MSHEPSNVDLRSEPGCQKSANLLALCSKENQSLSWRETRQDHPNGPVALSCLT